MMDHKRRGNGSQKRSAFNQPEGRHVSVQAIFCFLTVETIPDFSFVADFFCVSVVIPGLFPYHVAYVPPLLKSDPFAIPAFTIIANVGQEMEGGIAGIGTAC